MRFIKRSSRAAPKISLILADWSVRESLHLLSYLSNQSVPRDQFETIVVEYYATVSGAVRQFEHEVDTWLVLEMPRECYYHKHLNYNAGIAIARGEIIMIGDSDAMIKPSFVESIISTFARDPNIVLHLDEFRNVRRDLYPFRFPTFEEVSGTGCINNAGGKTTGVLDTQDPLHSRNYGACMCARRTDLIAIGGADMDIDYLGHICGPYEMTFRLMNSGLREVWSSSEFMYHTWHPGQAGVDNYLGPHDGQHLSLPALEALITKRRMPLVENDAIARLRAANTTSADDALSFLIDPAYLQEWNIQLLNPGRTTPGVPSQHPVTYKGFRLRKSAHQFVASPIGPLAGPSAEPNDFPMTGTDYQSITQRIDAVTPTRLAFVSWLAYAYSLLLPTFSAVNRRLGGIRQRSLRRLAAIVVIGLALPAIAIVFLIRPKRAWDKARSGLARTIEVRQILESSAVVLDRIRRTDNRGQCHADHVVLFADWLSCSFFRRLRPLGILSGIQLCSIDDIDAVQQFALRMQKRDWTGTIVVPSHILARFYVAIGQHIDNGRTVIV